MSKNKSGSPTMGGPKIGVAEDLDLEDRSVTVTALKRAAGSGSVTGYGLPIGNGLRVAAR